MPRCYDRHRRPAGFPEVVDRRVVMGQAGRNSLPAERSRTMRRTLQLLVVSMVAVGLGLGLAGCDDADKQLDKAKKSIGAAVIRNAAAIAGTAAFKENGHELKDT